MQRFPHALVIMVSFILFVSLLTYIIPQGQYERQEDTVLHREMVVPGSFHYIEPHPPSIFQTFMAVPEGMIRAADLLVLILLLGGSFYVIEKTGAIRDGVLFTTGLLQGKEQLGLLVISLLFATAGALNGMQEEIIALIPVLMFFTDKLGYNSYVTVCVSFGAAILGAAFSPMNPFAVGIAQKTAEVPLLSGGAYRMGVFLAAFLLWMGMVIRYANRTRKVPAEPQTGEKNPISARSAAILGMTAITFAVMIYGLLGLGWGFNEMSAEFFVLGIVAGLVGKLGLNGTSEAYIEGFKEMIFAVVIIGLANGITIILQKGLIIDTIIHGLFTPLGYLPKSLAAVSMMVAQALLHFPVPSYSGQAVLTMPILAPLSDLIGISRQVCVLAYQYGAVLMDLLTPTNGALMAVITLAGIRYNDWFRFIIRPLLAILLLCGFALVLAVFLGY